MKKLTCLLLVFTLVLSISLFSGCAATEEQDTSAKALLDCLTNHDIEGAKAYLSSHFSDQEKEQGIQEMMDALNRRSVEDLVVTNVYMGLKTEPGYSGTEKRINYRVTLSDGSQGSLETTWYSGEGYVRFYLFLDNPGTPQGDNLIDV